MNRMHLVIFAVLFLSFLVQFILAAGFVRRLHRWRQPLLKDNDCPKAVIVLCLRGGDPFLSKCISGLLTQDYPNYDLLFMVDHREDPAMAILNQVFAESTFERYRIEVLESPLTTCSLKCSSLVQAVEGLPSSIEIIALLDADTVPHSTWLRELVSALEPSHVGASTGNRWYMPTLCKRGSMIRYVWNAAAIVQMYWYEIAWGGTLAIKIDSLRRAGILERWRTAYGEDTMIRNELSRIGQKVVFVPSLMMINREECSVGSFQTWVRRQLLSARLYHPFWFLVVAHGLSSAALIVWVLLSSLMLFLNGDLWNSGVLLFALIAFQICLTCMLPWIENAVCEIAKARGEDVSWPRRPNWLVANGYAWLTQWTYTYALVYCLWMRSFSWRGIEYEVRGPWSIKMLGYRPYEAKSQSPDESLHSI